MPLLAVGALLVVAAIATPAHFAKPGTWAKYRLTDETGQTSEVCLSESVPFGLVKQQPHQGLQLGPAEGIQLPNQGAS